MQTLRWDHICCRHYTFYLWKNWFAWTPAARYLLVPVYMYSTWSVYCSLAKRQSVLWILLFALCTAATLVPAWLVEFRHVHSLISLS